MGGYGEGGYGEGGYGGSGGSGSLYPLSPPVGHHTAQKTKLTAWTTSPISVSPYTGSQQVYSFPGEGWKMDVALRPMRMQDAEYWIAFLLQLRGRVGTFLWGDTARKTLQGAGGGTPAMSNSASVLNVIQTASNGTEISIYVSGSPNPPLVVGQSYLMAGLTNQTWLNGKTVAVIGVFGSLGAWGFTVLAGVPIDPYFPTPDTGTATLTPSYNNAGDLQIVTNGWTPSVGNLLLPGDYLQWQAPGASQRLHKVLTSISSDASGNATIPIFPRLREPIPTGTAIVTSNCRGTFRLVNAQQEWDIDQALMYGLQFSAQEAL